MADQGLTVLGICGSLRKGSYNAALMRLAEELKPQGMTLKIAEIGSIPLYNEDVRAQGFPPPVETLRQQIKAADALLFGPKAADAPATIVCASVRSNDTA